MTDRFTETIVAPATIPGTGAISIIRVSGPAAFAAVDAVVKLRSGSVCEAEGYTIHFGEVFTKDNTLLDEVLVSVFRTPHSYTGEDSCEISCHASSFIASEIVSLLIDAGCRMAEPGEFSRRAYLNGKMDLAQAEAVADVISSNTSASHRIAMNQLKGGFSSELHSLRSELLDLTSLLELELDFSEEDVEFADRKRLLALTEATFEHVSSLADSFKIGNAIKNGIPVAIVGAANAGKSSLLNALLKEDRAIVSPVAGTTRDSIEETLVIDGVLFRFIDTAGIRDTSELVEKMGIERTYKAISKATVVLDVIDASSSEGQILMDLCSVVEHCDFGCQTLFILVNKADLVGDLPLNKIVTILNNYVSRTGIKAVVFSLSAKTGLGLSELKNAMSALQKDLKIDENSVFVTNIRHFEALKNAASALADVRTSLLAATPADLVAEDLRRSIRSINLILGTDLIDPDTVLHDIFRRHCIGK